jgi:putative FmdB family regulatory protein
MPIYDVHCEKCNENIEEWLKMDEEPRPCENCKQRRVKLPGGYFKLVYNNKTQICGWSDNNYETNRYWSEVKKARSEGHKVKGANED